MQPTSCHPMHALALALSIACAAASADAAPDCAGLVKNFTCVTPDASSRPLTTSDMILIQSSLRQRDMKLPNR